jgi:hypothetical protein
MLLARPALLLRAEGLALGAGALAVYADTGQSWLLFILLILAPDVAIAAYLAGRRLGAATYNLAHNLAFAIVLATVGVVADVDGAIAVALVWSAHVGFDRVLGYGLKYPTSFQDTHLDRV